MPELSYPSSLPACLSSLTESQRRQLNDSICNDEVSDDEEIMAHWCEAIGLTEPQALAAVELRGFCLMPLCQLFPA